MHFGDSVPYVRYCVSGVSGGRRAVWKDSFEGVKSVICDPRNIIRRILELSTSDHDWLSMQDISNFVE